MMGVQTGVGMGDFGILLRETSRMICCLSSKASKNARVKGLTSGLSLVSLHSKCTSHLSIDRREATPHEQV